MARPKKRRAALDAEPPRRIQAMVTYLHPFRIVAGGEAERWDATIEQINEAKWDYIKLHEVAGGIDVGLPEPYHMLVGRDGALALPPIPDLRDDQRSVEFFNRCLAALLLGGIYCEAITLDHLEFGAIIDWKYIRTYTPGRAAANRFHTLVRMRMAPPIEAIALLKPRTVEIAALSTAAAIGLAALTAVPPLSGEFLLKGVSGIARRDWGLALSNLWITIEQLTAFLWERDIVAAIDGGDDQIDGRRAQLNDTRTWTAANRQEMLHQKGTISTATLRSLYAARRARNELVHRGRHPGERAALAGYSATSALLKSALGGQELPLSALNLADHTLSDPFERKGPSEIISPDYWMPIPKLPSEEEIEQEEAASARGAGKARRRAVPPC